MKGHNYGGIPCKKCGKIHINPNKDKPIWKNKIHPNKGKKLTPEHILKFGKANKGRIKSKETLQKMRLNMLGKNKEEKNGMWKGNEVSYMGLHSWARRNKPKPKLCEDCKKFPPLDLANISGEYKRDLNDFKWICRKCHMKEDGRLKQLTSWRGD